MKQINFQQVRFEFSAGKADQLPTSDLPEIVFSGKSNVGKSSLINQIVQRKAIARTSSTPGKTATINSYLLPMCRLIDLPGYGYAKVSQSEQHRWSTLVESYFSSQRNIALVIQLVDMRHPVSKDDIQMINYLIDINLPFVLVCTKSDKLNKSQTEKQSAYFKELLTDTDTDFIPFSAIKHTGVDEVRQQIISAILHVE